jgi:hypothetical protein
MIDGKCNVKDCNNVSSKVTSTDSSYIEVCDDCFYEKYKK